MSDEPKVCDICGLPVRKGEHVTDGPPPCHTLPGLCIRRLKEEADRLRSAVAAAREWVRRNAVAEAAEEEGRLDGDNTMDVGDGKRRDASDWVYEAWDALRGALDDTTRDAWADRQAAICCAARRLAKADAAFTGHVTPEIEEEFDRALGALIAAVKGGR